MTKPIPRRKNIALVVLLALSAIAIAGPPATAQTAAEPAFIVEMRSDGSASIIVRSTFDLTTDAERQAFESLMDDEEAQQNARARFLDRMQGVASDATNATGREMSVTDPAIELRRTDDNETGIVTLSVTWVDLAAVDGETLRVTEPFASGFSSDRPVALRAPDGYTVASVSPAGDERSESSVTWAAGTDLAGLSVELVPEKTPTPTEAGTAVTNGQPGFGPLVAILAILGTAVIAARKSTRR